VPKITIRLCGGLIQAGRVTRAVCFLVGVIQLLSFFVAAENGAGHEVYFFFFHWHYSPV
jgi:biotin synthase-like enzyme